VTPLAGPPARAAALKPPGVANPREAHQSTHEIAAADAKRDFLIFMFS
jgi:hypothetical protein